MLDRIRRKLFLSLRIMSSDSPSSSENMSLSTAELKEILRRAVVPYRRLITECN